MDTNSDRAVAFLGMGASLGDRAASLRAAVERLRSNPEIYALRSSPVYESPHLGLNAGDEHRFPAHLNCVLIIETTLAPEPLLDALIDVEVAGGRTRRERWGPRTIDIDLLLYGDFEIRTERLTVPHPGIASRAFVLRPLADLAPDLLLPDGTAIADLLQSDQVRAQRIWRSPDSRNSANPRTTDLKT
jgi:2-amino-4-hydroxy-6-hydroxymethyldihydropteridine diphosphokinase